MAFTLTHKHKKQTFPLKINQFQHINTPLLINIKNLPQMDLLQSDHPSSLPQSTHELTLRTALNA